MIDQIKANLSDREASKLLNTDMLVELGVDRNSAEELVTLVFEELAKFETFWREAHVRIGNAYNKGDHITCAKRAVARGLLIGGLTNFLEEKTVLLSLALAVGLDALKQENRR